MCKIVDYNEICNKLFVDYENLIGGSFILSITVNDVILAQVEIKIIDPI